VLASSTPTTHGAAALCVVAGGRLHAAFYGLDDRRVPVTRSVHLQTHRQTSSPRTCYSMGGRAAVGMGIPMGILMGMGMVWVWVLWVICGDF